MKGRSLVLIAVVAIVVLQTVLAVPRSSPVASGQGERHCLDNDGMWSVPPGASYSDTSGVWVCAPGDPTATGGGWLLMTMTPAPTATTMPTSAPAAAATPATAPPGKPATAADHGGGLSAPLLAVSLVVVVGSTTLMSLLAGRRGRRLTGFIVIEKEHSSEGS